MKYRHAIITLASVLLILTGTAEAQVLAMTDSELERITGQAGIAATTYSQFQGNLSTINLLPLPYQPSVSAPPSSVKFSSDGTAHSFEIKNPGFSRENIQTQIRLGDQGPSIGTFAIDRIRVTTHGTVRITVR